MKQTNNKIFIDDVYKNIIKYKCSPKLIGRLLILYYKNGYIRSYIFDGLEWTR